MNTRTMAAAAATMAAMAMLAACSKAPEATDTAAAPAEEHVDHAEAPVAAALPRTPSPAGATVSIVSPLEGETVSNPVKVVFGISGMTLAPAGTIAENAGHHHLLIDTDLADAGVPIPADEKHVHFGKAQTETTVELTPGAHTLQLVLGDALHIPHDPVVASTKVNIVVK